MADCRERIAMEAIQQVVTVLFVLGLLAGTLYWLRGKGAASFTGRGFGRLANRQMQSIERLPLTAQHSLHLVSVAGRTLLIAVSPGGCSLLDNGVSGDTREILPVSHRTDNP
jgi:flagellar biogenesis protein FliO